MDSEIEKKQLSPLQRLQRINTDIEQIEAFREKHPDDNQRLAELKKQREEALAQLTPEQQALFRTVRTQAEVRENSEAPLVSASDLPSQTPLMDRLNRSREQKPSPAPTDKPKEQVNTQPSPSPLNPSSRTPLQDRLNRASTLPSNKPTTDKQ